MRWNKKDFQSTNVGIIPFNNLISWAWWLPALIWIGPRHTNYHPLGSICSFEPEDRTWQRGQLLITLLDLQVLWIVRHIFLRRFRSLRDRLASKAQQQGIRTDEDVFDRVS